MEDNLDVKHALSCPIDNRENERSAPPDPRPTPASFSNPDGYFHPRITLRLLFGSCKYPPTVSGRDLGRRH